jgi:hypothetical protein
MARARIVFTHSWSSLGFAVVIAGCSLVLRSGSVGRPEEATLGAGASYYRAHLNVHRERGVPHGRENIAS